MRAGMATAPGHDSPIHDALPALKAALAADGARRAGRAAGRRQDHRDAAGADGRALGGRRQADRAGAAPPGRPRRRRAHGRDAGRARWARRSATACGCSPRSRRATRIEVVTEGVFTRMILDDPGLEGVAAVLFDEFHERSLDADLGLAFARDARAVLRADLRLLVMSATLDPAPVAALLGDAPVIESQGRDVPGRDPLPRPRSGAAHRGPGGPRGHAGRWRRTTGGAAGLPARPGRDPSASPSGWPSALRDPAVEIAPLYGALTPAAAGPRHRAGAGRPPQGGAGHLHRRDQPDHRGRAGGDRRRPGPRAALRSGQRPDAAGDRAGLRPRRPTSGAAGRGAPSPASATACGTRRETRGLVALRPPGDPGGRPRRRGARPGAAGAPATARVSPSSIRRPPPPWPRRARLLQRLGALDAAGALTAARPARWPTSPLPPRLAHMVLRGAASGQADRAARIAALLVERGLGGRDVDLRAAPGGASAATAARAPATPARWPDRWAR